MSVYLGSKTPGIHFRRRIYHISINIKNTIAIRIYGYYIGRERPLSRENILSLPCLTQNDKIKKRSCEDPINSNSPSPGASRYKWTGKNVLHMYYNTASVAMQYNVSDYVQRQYQNFTQAASLNSVKIRATKQTKL